jgi:hypothetical protein
MWGIQGLTLGMFWLVFGVSRGPVMGCHVAPYGWLMVLYKIYVGSPGSNPRPSSGKRTGRAGAYPQPLVVLPPYGYGRRGLMVNVKVKPMVPGLTPWDSNRYHTEHGEVTSLARRYMLAHRTRSWSVRKGGQRIARGASA